MTRHVPRYGLFSGALLMMIGLEAFISFAALILQLRQMSDGPNRNDAPAEFNGDLRSGTADEGNKPTLTTFKYCFSFIGHVFHYFLPHRADEAVACQHAEKCPDKSGPNMMAQVLQAVGQ